LKAQKEVSEDNRQEEFIVGTDRQEKGKFTNQALPKVNAWYQSQRRAQGTARFYLREDSCRCAVQGSEERRREELDQEKGT